MPNRTCTNHEGAPAIAVCATCGDDICGGCHGVDRRGMAICTPCRTDGTLPQIPWEADDKGPTPHGFAETALTALTRPRTFFRHFGPSHDWGWAALFGMICIALGTLVNTVWQKAFSDDYAARLEYLHDEFGISTALVELGLFGAIPVGAVVFYLVHTALLYLALRAFAVEEATWSMTARITGYSLAAYLLMVFPPLGQFNLGYFLMVVWLFNLEVAAVRWFFGVGFWKSMGVVVLPFMVFVLAMS